MEKIKENFDNVVHVRFSEEQTKEIDAVVKSNLGTYKNRSHFIRVAMLKLIREDESYKLKKELEVLLWN